MFYVLSNDDAPYKMVFTEKEAFASECDCIDVFNKDGTHSMSYVFEDGEYSEYP